MASARLCGGRERKYDGLADPACCRLLESEREDMRILLTGGAGFIGSHIAEHLLEHGHELAVIDDLSTGRRDNLPESVLSAGRFYEADIRGDCSEVFESFRPEALCHQAAQMDVRRSVAEPEFDAEVNVVGTLRLLQSCVQHGVGMVVFASSGGAIYGEQDAFPADESHYEYPVSPYGVSKLCAERYLHYYKVQHGLRYVALRYANVYGPRQDPHGEAGVVAIFSGNLVAGAASKINGDGSQTRDYVYVSDVARANVLALQSDAPCGAYNIGTAVETSVNELYTLMRVACGGGPQAEHAPAKPGEQLRSCVDPSRAEKVLGWRPEVSLAKGLEATLESFGDAGAR
jgi:UDP-glucose 4-epimerase